MQQVPFNAGRLLRAPSCLGATTATAAHDVERRRAPGDAQGQTRTLTSFRRPGELAMALAVPSFPTSPDSMLEPRASPLPSRWVIKLQLQPVPGMLMALD